PTPQHLEHTLIRRPQLQTELLDQQLAHEGKTVRVADLGPSRIKHALDIELLDFDADDWIGLADQLNMRRHAVESPEPRRHLTDASTSDHGANVCLVEMEEHRRTKALTEGTSIW